jgi:hypothetical protein
MRNIMPIKTITVRTLSASNVIFISQMNQKKFKANVNRLLKTSHQIIRGFLTISSPNSTPKFCHCLLKRPATI